MRIMKGATHSFLAKHMIPRFFVIASCFVLLCASAIPAEGDQTLHPLAPPDRSSPRATLNTFLDSMNRAVAAYKLGHLDKARALVAPAVECLNLETEPPALRSDIGLDAALLLKEVLDRIEIPPDQEIPDAKTVRTEKISGWTIPYTEITIAAVKEDPSTGRFLFTSGTVNSAEKFYDKVKTLPYRHGTGEGALFEQISSSAGRYIPHEFVKRLPNWARATVYGQAVWQWVGLALYFFIGSMIILLVSHYGGKALDLLAGKLDSNLKRWVLGPILPATLIVLSGLGLRITVQDLHIISANAYLPIAYVFTSLSYLGAVWLIGVLLNRIADLAIAVSGFASGDMDVQLIRLAANILTVIIVVLATMHLGARLGLPTYSLVAGLGIGGVAVALAGREALSNLIGTIMIVFDRPFKLGDYVILSDGERGAVAEVGFRSTRIRTRDDILISIPNSVVANTKMINESAPVSLSRIRVKVGVAYGSDLKNVEKTLLDVAEQNETVVSEPAPRVRFRHFGDSALEFELLCWIDLPELKGPTIHQLNWAIHEEFRKQGIDMPFPQRDVHIRTNK